jgi:hypothetical protein
VEDANDTEALIPVAWQRLSALQVEAKEVIFVAFEQLKAGIV